MKVWHVTKTLYGGAGLYALRLSNALREAGVDSSVLSLDEQGAPGTAELKLTAGTISRLATRVVRSLSHRLTSAPYHSLMGMETSRGEHMPNKGDIIHLHGLTGWMGVKGLSRLIPEGSPVYWTAHDLWPMSGGCIIYSGCQGYRDQCRGCPVLKRGFKIWARAELGMKKSFVRKSTARPVANSRWMVERIKESAVFEGHREVPIVLPIVDPIYFSTDIQNLRDELAIPKGKKILSLGARAVTDRFKGIPEFLSALASRPELARQFVVLLFGEGELELPEGLDVRILGRLDSAEEIAQVYSTSDVFVSPSAMETFGMALAEAQACGTPVAAFDVGGVRDAVSEQCAEFLVPNGDFEGLLNALGKVFEKSSSTDGGWRVNRDWVRERFKASVIGAKQKAVYDNK